MANILELSILGVMMVFVIFKKSVIGMLCVFALLTMLLYNNRPFYERFDDFGMTASPAGSPGTPMLPEQVKQQGLSSSVSAGPTTVPFTPKISTTVTEIPYEQEAIDELDDYEYNAVFQNESEKPLSKELRDKLMSQYPMHWTGYPPSSSQFQAGLRESFQGATQNVPDDAKPYQNVSESNLTPPDMSAVEIEERKILQTYTPKFPPQGVTYDIRDANELITKLYDAKGLIPEVKHQEGTNVYEIIGTRSKNAKVVYEDEVAPAPAGNVPNSGAGEGNIVSPFAVSNDPFYDINSPKAGKNPWNYTSWTPGLERVFAPTEPKKEWY